MGKYTGCDTPYRAIRAGEYKAGRLYNEDVIVPCGKCPPCKMKRVFQWVFRLEEEDRVSVSSSFVTLTYDTENIPISKNGYKTLHVPEINKKTGRKFSTHFQLFIKKLRKCQKRKIKYYMVGEYGEKTKRPHYHAIMFNTPGLNILEECWQYGSVHQGQVNAASISYVAQYINKSVIIPAWFNDDREKEFSRMSKGLGKSFLSKAMMKYYEADNTRQYVSRSDGVKLAMPRFYKEKLFTDEERVEIASYQKHLMQELEIDMEDEYNKNPENNVTWNEYSNKLKYARHKRYYKNQKERDKTEI